MLIKQEKSLSFPISSSKASLRHPDFAKIQFQVFVIFRNSHCDHVQFNNLRCKKATKRQHHHIFHISMASRILTKNSRAFSNHTHTLLEQQFPSHLYGADHLNQKQITVKLHKTSRRGNLMVVLLAHQLITDPYEFHFLQLYGSSRRHQHLYIPYFNGFKILARG